jgi:CRISPR system Cascade subunit CasC
MKLIELHILQSFPVSCLNRDDVGAPKSATFGGVPRARLSSQCMKRAIREYAQDNLPEARFGGDRTKLIVRPLADALASHGIADEKVAMEHASYIADKLAKLDAKSVKDGQDSQVGTLTFLAPSEIDSIGQKVAALVSSNPNAKDYEKKLDQFAKAAGLMDAADIALFGRMAASMPSLTLEGAAMFSHALSTHKTENDLDFFSAVDDRKPKGDDAGAGMIGTLEFNAAVYYRYAAINVDLLFDADHLGKLNSEERSQVVAAFIKATVMAVPGARKNSMNASVPPSCVLGLYKAAGQPVQLINAFEKPIRGNGSGLVAASIKEMTDHHQQLKTTWGIETTTEVLVPEDSLATLIEKLTSHVQ